MIIKNNEALARINSPMNLINKMKNIQKSSKTSNAMNVFGMNRSVPEIKEVIKDVIKGTTFKIPEFVKPAEVVIEVKRVIEVEQVTNQVPQNLSELSHPVFHSLIRIPEAIPGNISSPKTDDIIDDADTKIKLASVHDNALSLLSEATNG